MMCKRIIKLKSKYHKATKNILKKSMQEKRPYSVKLLDKMFIVYPKVFSPKYFNDTEFFAREVSLHLHQGDEFLEIGSGTGIITIFAVLRGAKRAIATDINPEAVKNTKENAKIHRLDHLIEVRNGDVFKPLKPTEKFDSIFWNIPFGYIREKSLSMIERSVFDPEYKNIDKFINGAKAHLKETGRLLIGFSPTLGYRTKLMCILINNGYRVRVIKEINSTEIYPVKFQLLEAMPKSVTK